MHPEAYPLRILKWVRKLEGHLVTGMAYVCGGLFLILAFYTTFDVLGRRFGGPFSGVTDEMGEYALALGSSWALAYTLRAGGHVRVDVLLPYVPSWLRGRLDAFAMALMAVFAGTVSVYLWALAGSSRAIGATGHSIIQTPQWVPQAMVAAGYSLLALVSLTSCLAFLLGVEDA
jgi:TRAP-type C4-dicarboxylate transport system permease small subunit